MSFARRRDPSQKKDDTTFTLVKMNKNTGQELIEGQRTITGAATAEREHRLAITDLPKSEIESGWTWDLRPRSGVARRRLAFGFHPGRN